MIQRFLTDSMNRSFFLLGPRGVGKSTWLRDAFRSETTLWVNLLESKEELELNRNPDLLLDRWKGRKGRPAWIVIDEIQKIPKLLDVVHRGIEEYRIKFALTGSSARKLRRGAANLLAGRANEFHLFPFTSFELGPQFDLTSALRWGTLPGLFADEVKSEKEKARFLYSYVSTYLQQEIAAEQLVRQLDPFRRFLPSAAQMNGKILNYSKIGADAGVDYKQVGRYFEILFDTLLGFYLEPHDNSLRKRQVQKSKFYFFDTGVTRAILSAVEQPLHTNTYEFGDLFEHFVILEFMRLSAYMEKRHRFAFLRTKDDAEIDLIIEPPRGRPYCIEIKSSDRLDKSRLSSFKRLSSHVPKGRFYWLSRCSEEVEIDNIRCLPWQKGIAEILDLSTRQLPIIS